MPKMIFISRKNKKKKICVPTLHKIFRSITRNTLTVKPALSGHSKIDKTKGLKSFGSIMQVKSIAECSPSLSDIKYWKPFLVFFLSGRLRQILLNFFIWPSEKLFSTARAQYSSSLL